MYKVTSAIDHLDPNPDVVYFEDFYEAQDHVTEIVDKRVDGYDIEVTNYDDILETEYSLINIEKVS